MNRFHQAIKGKQKISVIAEVKRRSPSHGNFPQHDLDVLMKQYEEGGADAISVVTEKALFDGSLELFKEVRKRTKLPMIRKDFIQRIEQIEETAEARADAILLIAKKLEHDLLKKFIEEALKNKLDIVLEIHDMEDFEKVQSLPETLKKMLIIGINNRNLSTFKVNADHAQNFLPLLENDATIIAESGFSKAEEMIPYEGKIDAVLIGTTLLTSKSPFRTLSSFTNHNLSLPQS